jgi:isoleucyl-tRNA synthetase
MRVVRTGLVYRGSKPVMWSPVERTSLAEAEVEYEEKTSTAIWVKFPVAGGIVRNISDEEIAKREALLRGACVVIWTTTPWTIPGNRAISYSADVAYGVYEVETIEQGLAFEPWVKSGDKLIFADKLAEDALKSA